MGLCWRLGVFRRIEVKGGHTVGFNRADWCHYIALREKAILRARRGCQGIQPPWHLSPELLFPQTQEDQCVGFKLPCGWLFTVVLLAKSPSHQKQWKRLAGGKFVSCTQHMSILVSIPFPSPARPPLPPDLFPIRADLPPRFLSSACFALILWGFQGNSAIHFWLLQM